MANWNPKANDVFLEALEITDAADRLAHLSAACAQDPVLLAQVESMLAASDRAASFLQTSPDDRRSAVAGAGDDALSEAPGTVIGPYKLLEQIGEGGFGVVFMAEQQQPLRRKVALKVIKAGMDTKQVIARFEAERQALALMDHPNIAKVLDAGATASGRPYFVMELVRGVPITAYCDEAHLNPRERLELFVHVCDAVQHAHQKGIIHRDIKPSNVLITLHDGKPMVKVIDFGIAKATGQQLTEKTLFTNFAQMVGTPLYMSPEQAGAGLDVDTRSDIYGLGVLLYELLTGSTPFDKERLKSAAFEEIRRIIREEEPPRPSTRLSGSNTLASIAAMCKTEPRRLSHLFRGEVDWIVMKALEKDRNRRYETANGFAMDVQRYLNDEAVEACPPSAMYRLGKIARRNKRSLAVAALVLFFLVVLGGGVSWTLLDRAARRDRIAAQVDVILNEVDQLQAEQKWPQALAAALRAEVLMAGGADAATQDRVRQSLHDLRFVALLDELRLREPRDIEYQGKVDTSRPFLYAAAFRDFGVDVETLPAEESAARLLARPAIAVALAAALDDWARTGRPQAPEQSKRLWALASAVDPDPWRVSVRQSSTTMDVDALLRLANARDTAGQPPQSQLLLASSLRLTDQPEQALALLERACELHPGDFWIHFSLAWLNVNVHPKRLEASLRHAFAARALRPESATTWLNLGVTLNNMGQLDQAMAAFDKAIELNPKNAEPHVALGIIYKAQGKMDEAIAAYRRAIELDPRHAGAHNNLGTIQCDFLRNYDEAVACFRTAVELDPLNAKVHDNLGNALRGQGKLDEAIASLRKAIALDPNYADPHHGLGAILCDDLRDYDKAIASLYKALEIDPNYALAYSGLGVALSKTNKPAESLAAHHRAVELDPKDARIHANLALELLVQNRLDEAVAVYGVAIGLDPKNSGSQNNLGGALRAQGKLDAAAAAFREAIKLEPKYAAAHFNLGLILLEQKKLPDALAALRMAIAFDPKHAAAHVNVGNVLKAQGNLHEAIGMYRIGVGLDPGSAPAQNSLGLALRDPKSLPESIACFRQAIKLGPTVGVVHANLGIALWMQGKPDEAIASYKKALELDPKLTYILFSLGMACYRTGDWKATVAAMEESMTARSGGDSNEWFYLAMAHWQLGEKDVALKWYSQAAQWMARNNPANGEFRRMRAEAHALLGVNDHRLFQGHTEPVRSVAFLPNGSRALSAGIDKTIRLWDVASGKELSSWSGHTAAVWSVVLSPDGSRALSGSWDGTMRLWDVADGKELLQFGHPKLVWSVAFSPDGRRALSACQDGIIRLWDLQSGKELAKFEGHTDVVRSVAFAPDGRTALSASHDKSVRLWDMATGKEIRRMEGHTNLVLSVAFSPNGLQALSGGCDRVLRLWDVETGVERGTFVGHQSNIEGLAFSFDGQRGLSGGADGTIRLWDLKTGKELHCIVTDDVLGVALSSDGRHVLAANADHRVRLWTLPDLEHESPRPGKAPE